MSATRTLALTLAFATPGLADETPWPADVPGHVAVEPGEHPRLFFRKSDLPELRERAKTPEGRAILERLRVLLNGSDGETMPELLNDMTSAYGKTGPKPRPEEWPDGTYSISHAAGFGLLYQLTGDRKYADLGRRCFELAFDGVRDRDREARYSWVEPGGALRAGPSLGWYAVGYDLCYDGWEPEFREKVARAIQDYNQGPGTSLPELVRGSRHMPASNHWGMQVGGGALALLAIHGDPGVDRAKLDALIPVGQKAMVRNLTEGFGDRGWFAEGDGTGAMASNIAFAPALIAWRVAAGKDFVSPRPNARWMYLKWLMNTLAVDGEPVYPSRGAYPHNVWARDGVSGPGTFSIGFGIVPDEYKPALMWLYDRVSRPADETERTPAETSSGYPHHAVLAFVNWPVGLAAADPSAVMPAAVIDSMSNLCSFRNRWRDQDDILITVQTVGTKGWHKAPADGQLWIWANGERHKWGRILGRATHFEATDTGGVLTVADGTSLAVDFSGASGADAMIVLSGKNVPDDHRVELDGRRFAFRFVTGGAAPEPRVDGGAVVVGGQTVRFRDGRLSLDVAGRGVSLAPQRVPLAGEPFPLTGVRFVPRPGEAVGPGEIRFRARGEKGFRSARLEPDGNSYRGTIPADVTGGPFEYFLAFGRPGDAPVTHPPGGADSPLAVVPDAGPPTMTGPPEATEAHSYGVRLRWPEARDDLGVAGYRVRRQTGTGEPELLAELGPEARRFLDPEPPAGRGARYSVEPVDVAGRVGRPTEVAVDVPPDLPPRNLLRPVATGVADSVVVTWRGKWEPDVTTLLVERAGPGEEEFAPLAEVAVADAARWADEKVEAGKPYRYRLRLRDAGGHVSEPGPAASAVPGTFLRRINCGGPELLAADGVIWESDNGPVGGMGISSVDQAVAGSSEELMPVFRTERWANVGMRYAFDVRPGKYVVRLLFAETNPRFQAEGKRVFDVSIDGEIVAEGVDVFAEVGAVAAFERTFEVVRDRAGPFDVVLRRRAGVGPALKGIEVRQAGE